MYWQSRQTPPWTIKKSYDEIDAVIEAAMQVVAEPGEEGGLQKAHTALAEAIKRGFDETEAKLVKCSALFDKTLAIVGEAAPE